LPRRCSTPSPKSFALELAWRLDAASCSECNRGMRLDQDHLAGFRERPGQESAALTLCLRSSTIGCSTKRFRHNLVRRLRPIAESSIWQSGRSGLLDPDGVTASRAGHLLLRPRYFDLPMFRNVVEIALS